MTRFFMPVSYVIPVWSSDQMSPLEFRPRVEQGQSEAAEIPHVPGRQRGSANQGDGRNLRVENRDRLPGQSSPGHERGICLCRRRVEWQDAPRKFLLENQVQLVAQRRVFSSARQDCQTESDFGLRDCGGVEIV